MSPLTLDRRHHERLIAYARPIILLLSLLALLEDPKAAQGSKALGFLAGYLIAGVLIIGFERVFEKRNWYFPLFFDVAALGVFLYLSPSHVAVWFPYLLVAYAAGSRWGSRAAVFLMGLLSLSLVLRIVLQGEIAWHSIPGWVILVGATFAAGAGLAFLGDSGRRFTAESEFLAHISASLQVEQGLAESLRLLLDQLARAFDAEEALLAYRDGELERVFLWRVKPGTTERISPESLPLARADGFLLDDMDATVCWNSLEGRGAGFGWDRRDGRRLKTLPRLPGPSQQELNLHSLMTATFEQDGQAAGRVYVLNGSKKFTREDLGWLERIALHVGPPLENLFLLRHMRARAIEGERSRISRDLHDGILQTLLSIEIQIDVLRRKLPEEPEQVAASLSNLQQTVRNESGELRRMVTDLRPLKVQSADLVDLMRGFGERYRNESTVALDLLIDAVEIQAPDHVCREIFQIYREALNNIKKHAKASHVVVKLTQDESRIVLVVDDNGEGFSFAGRFTGDELDRLRLGPISIKEHTRTVGGGLTIESNPGHGARLTIEVPLG